MLGGADRSMNAFEPEKNSVADSRRGAPGRVGGRIRVCRVGRFCALASFGHVGRAAGRSFLSSSADNVLGWSYWFPLSGQICFPDILETIADGDRDFGASSNRNSAMLSAATVSSGSTSFRWWFSAPPNKWLQLTVQLVTPFAYAKGAPSCPAAEPGC